jgi:hypothetical protein
MAGPRQKSPLLETCINVANAKRKGAEKGNIFRANGITERKAELDQTRTKQENAMNQTKPKNHPRHAIHAASER